MFSGWEIKALSRKFIYLTYCQNSKFWTELTETEKNYWDKKNQKKNRNYWVTSQRMIIRHKWSLTRSNCAPDYSFGDVQRHLQGFVVRIKFALPVLPDAFKLHLHFCTKSCETVDLRWDLKTDVKSINIWSFRIFVVVAVWMNNSMIN